MSVPTGNDVQLNPNYGHQGTLAPNMALLRRLKKTTMENASKLVCLGAIAISVPFMATIDWRVVVVAVLALAVVRPVIGWLSLLGSGHPPAEIGL
jgi:hypothetical protein